MSRRPAVLHWPAPPTAAEALRARVLALKVELAEAEDRLYALQTAPLPPPPADVFLKASDAAARFGWHADTIRRWAASGRIRSVGSGGRVRVSTADLAAMQRPAPAARAALGRSAGEAR